METKNTEALKILKQRMIVNTKTAYAKIVLFEDGQRFIVSTTLYNGIATTYIYNLLGFDEVGNHLYDPAGMRIGRSEATKPIIGYIEHFDKFYFKIGNDPKKYNRIKEAFKAYAED